MKSYVYSFGGGTADGDGTIADCGGSRPSRLLHRDSWASRPPTVAPAARCCPDYGVTSLSESESASAFHDHLGVHAPP